jgi:hypothetical protein
VGWLGGVGSRQRFGNCQEGRNHLPQKLPSPDLRLAEPFPRFGLNQSTRASVPGFTFEGCRYARRDGSHHVWVRSTEWCWNFRYLGLFAMLCNIVPLRAVVLGFFVQWLQRGGRGFENMFRNREFVMHNEDCCLRWNLGWEGRSEG